MAEVLSQSEIDQLINAISMGETLEEEEAPSAGGEHRIKPYDFSTANKFSKEQMRTLSIIFESFGRQLSTHFSGTLRTLCDVTVVSVEELVFREFNNSLPSPVLIPLFSMSPLSGSLLLAINPSVAYGIISRLFGGEGEAEENGRTFTEIEIAVMERITRQMLPHMVSAWEKIAKVEPILERIETSSQFTQIVNLNEAVAIITMEVKTSSIDGYMSFCLPHIALEPIIKTLTTTRIFTTGSSRVNDAAPVNSANIRQRIMNTGMNVKAVLSETTMTVGDILSLQLGDVIQLDNRVGEDIKVNVEHLPKAYGKLGVRNNHYAIKLCKIIKEEESVDE